MFLTSRRTYADPRTCPAGGFCRAAVVGDCCGVLGVRLERALRCGVGDIPAVAGSGLAAVALRRGAGVAAAQAHHRRSRLYADVPRCGVHAQHWSARGNCIPAACGAASRTRRGAVAPGDPARRNRRDLRIRADRRVQRLDPARGWRRALSVRHLEHRPFVRRRAPDQARSRIGRGDYRRRILGLGLRRRGLRPRPDAGHDPADRAKLLDLARHSGHDARGLRGAGKRPRPEHRPRLARGRILHRHAGGEPAG
jgi:hypothetical protein